MIRRRKATNWVPILLIAVLIALPVRDGWFGARIEPVGFLRGLAQVLGGLLPGWTVTLGRGAVRPLVGVAAGPWPDLGDPKGQAVTCLQNQGRPQKAVATGNLTGFNLAGAGARVAAPMPRGFA